MAMRPGSGQFDAGMFADIDRRGARAGLRAELGARLSPAWAAWASAEAAYDSAHSWYARTLAGLRARW